MKLIRYGSKERQKPGVEIDGIRFDCSNFFKDWDYDFFANDGLSQLGKVLETETLEQVRDTERWASPIARPGMIMCIGLNYSDHAKESGMAIPTEPILFMKASNTLSGPYDKVVIPKGSEKTDWEVELGIVLGRNISYLKDEEEAAKAIAGYCVVHDVSERAFQLEKGGQWVKGKSCPGFSPVGPYLVTQDEIENVHNLSMSLTVNDEERQNGNTKTMIFKSAYIVWYLSQFMKMEAGDLISTGTPPGVGIGMDPPTFLKPGDVVELEIDSLGSQRQMFVEYAG